MQDVYLQDFYVIVLFYLIKGPECIHHCFISVFQY